MAVYDRRYRGYDGELAPKWRRSLVIPRYAYADAFASRRFLIMYAACFIPSMIALLMVFMSNNLEALTTLNINPNDFVAVRPGFFHALAQLQNGLGFLLALTLGPSLVSPDLEHSALPLYLSRPISRRDYALGKMLVVFLLMSSVTWVVVLVVFALQSAFAGPEWSAAHGWIAAPILTVGLVWSTVVSIVAVSISAWLKWRPVAAGALFALFVVPSGFAEVINELFDTSWGTLISPTANMVVIADALFRQGENVFTRRPPLAPEAAAVGLAALVVAAVLMLRLRLRAYEVVT